MCPRMAIARGRVNAHPTEVVFSGILPVVVRVSETTSTGSSATPQHHSPGNVHVKDENSMTSNRSPFQQSLSRRQAAKLAAGAALGSSLLGGALPHAFAQATPATGEAE